jgi:hypothetical protein
MTAFSSTSEMQGAFVELSVNSLGSVSFPVGKMDAGALGSTILDSSSIMEAIRSGEVGVGYSVPISTGSIRIGFFNEALDTRLILIAGATRF